ncbi:hypothetical protein [Actinocrispum wychmicini]|uniref:Uncharacterized protein n=1 Tax=Actinocrispum wychmicini TaxID=1213861 RepID=A0A4R2JRD3_9PSEU|nr:hypothetical protein [Actinocrispum wychmicini]TCO62811.1 hypothetical protein EV192_102950 [Actinocrispum wychmicini]
MIALLVVNAVFAAVSVGFAVMAVARPATLSRSPTATSGERFYAWMYAIRAVPLGVVAAILPATSPGPATMVVLIAAAVVQLADAGIGVSRREWGMVAGATAAAIVHMITAVAIR